MKHILVTLFVTLFLTTNVSAADTANTRLVVNNDLFIAACAKKESGGNDNAIGDKHLPDHAYGFLQIRRPCVEDVNRRFGTNYKAQDMLGNRALSIWVCLRYLELHATHKRLGHEPTYEDVARIWNGGPCGAFDKGAINKKGDLLKNPAQRARLAQLQLNAKRYAVSLQKILNSQMIANR
jgi:hypothetical protein